MANTRPCAACRHLDSRVLQSGTAYCWARYVWERAQGTVEDCDKAERPDGNAPPNQIWFAGQGVRE